MGYAIADAFANCGADVTLVSGPTLVSLSNPSVKLVRVMSAAQMFEACKAEIQHADIALFAAAVADFTPESVADKKIKREKDNLVLKLKPTTDIAAELGKQKRPDQFFIGFALETNEGITNAKEKLHRKNLDMIVLNSLEDKGAGFGTDTNKVTIIDKSGTMYKFDLKQKQEVARDIVDMTIKLMNHA